MPSLVLRSITWGGCCSSSKIVSRSFSMDISYFLRWSSCVDWMSWRDRWYWSLADLIYWEWKSSRVETSSTLHCLAYSASSLWSCSSLIWASYCSFISCFSLSYNSVSSSIYSLSIFPFLDYLRAVSIVSYIDFCSVSLLTESSTFICRSSSLCSRTAFSFLNLLSPFPMMLESSFWSLSILSVCSQMERTWTFCCSYAVLFIKKDGFSSSCESNSGDSCISSLPRERSTEINSLCSSFKMDA